MVGGAHPTKTPGSVGFVRRPASSSFGRGVEFVRARRRVRLRRALGSSHPAARRGWRGGRLIHPDQMWSKPQFGSFGSGARRSGASDGSRSDRVRIGLPRSRRALGPLILIIGPGRPGVLTIRMHSKPVGPSAPGGRVGVGGARARRGSGRWTILRPATDGIGLNPSSIEAGDRARKKGGGWTEGPPPAIGHPSAFGHLAPSARPGARRTPSGCVRFSWRSCTRRSARSSAWRSPGSRAGGPARGSGRGSRRPRGASSGCAARGRTASG